MHTFAYFSVTTQTTSATTTVTGTTPKTGIISLETKQTNLYLKPTADDFSYANSSQDAKNKLYAVTSAEGKPSYTDSPIEIATLTLSDASEKASYSCTANLKITFEEGDTLAEVLKEADGFLKITAENSTGFNNFSDSNLNLSNTTGVSLNSIYEAAQETENSVSGDVGFSLKEGTTTSISVKASLWLVNTSEIQNSGINNIADKTLNMKIELTDLTCDAVQSTD